MPDETLASPSDSAPTPGGGVTISGQTSIGGDVVGRDKIVHNIQNIYQRALTAAEEAAQDRHLETQRLAHGVSELAQQLQARASDTADTAAGSPYKGLLEYRLGDTEIFFGRDRAVHELLAAMEGGSLTILHSESGAGKTSLLQAGISPRIIGAGHLPLYLRPYNANPAFAVKRAFISDPGQTPFLATAPLRDFLRQVCSVLGPYTRLYIFLDQFEEFFTRLDEPERADFVGELAECLEDTGLNVCWVLALRTEHFGNLANLRPRIRNPFENDYRLNRLRRDEAEEIITKPAAARGITFEDGLIGALLNDLGKSEIAPPQLQLVCSALYHELEPGEKFISRALYDREGGAPGILRGHLERVLSRDLLPEQRAAARRLLESLITSEQQRIIRPHAELVAELSARGITPATLDTILQQLVDSRLIRPQETESGLAYELAHDYLLNEIKLDPEVQSRKAAQELLEQEVRAYRRYKTLLAPERLAVIEQYFNDLTISLEAAQLINESKVAVLREEVEREESRQREVETARKLAEEQQKRADEQRQRAEDQERTTKLLQWRARLLAAALGITLALILFAGYLSTQIVRIGAQVQANADAARTAEAKALAQADALATEAVAHAAEAAARATAEAVAKRNEEIALANEEKARQQELAAVSRQLAAQARQFFGTQLDIALLLSLEANNVADTVEARGTLRDGLNYSPLAAHFFRFPDSFITASALSPNGQWLATGRSDGRVIFWNAETETGRPLTASLTAESLTGVTALAFNHSGTRLAVGYSNATIVLWDVSQLPQRPRRVTRLVGHTSDITSIDFRVDDAMMASADSASNIILWDTASSPNRASILANLVGHLGAVRSVAFSPVGASVASGGSDGKVFLWDVSDPVGGVRYTIYDDNDASTVNTVAFSADGALLASGAADGYIIVRDLNDEAVPNRFRMNSSSVNSLTFSPNSNMFATASDDGTIRLWSYGGTLFNTLRGQGNITQVAFSRNGGALVSTSFDGSATLWNLETDHLLNRKIGMVRTSVYSAIAWRGDRVAASTESIIELWDTATGTLDGELSPEIDITALALDPDGNMLAVASGGVVQLWNLTASTTTFFHQADLDIDEADVNTLAFSPDGSRLAVGSCFREENFVCIEGWILVWDVRNGTLINKLAGHSGEVSTVDFGPDGTTLVSGGGDSIIVWDLQTGNKKAPERHLPDSIVTTVSFSPDSKTVVAGNTAGALLFWDTSQPIARVTSNIASGVFSSAIDPEGETLAVVDNGGAITLWDVRTAQRIGDTLPGVYPITSLDFSADGGTLMAADANATLTLWTLDADTFRARACQIANRNLSRAEWHRYFPSQPYHVTCAEHARPPVDAAILVEDVNSLLAAGEDEKAQTTLAEAVQELIASNDLSSVSSACLLGARPSLASTTQPVCAHLVELAAVSDDSGLIESACFSLVSAGLQAYSAPICTRSGELALATENVSAALNACGLPAEDGLGSGRLDYCRRAFELVGRVGDAWMNANACYDARFSEGLGEVADPLCDRAVELAAQTDDANLNNDVCWYEGLFGHGRDAMPACERAVELAPDDGAIRDSRGLARAQIGNYPGAIEDFQAFIEDLSSGVYNYLGEEVVQARIAQRQLWIDALRVSRNPFDEATLKHLREEQ